MISRRNYVTITSLMLVLLFLFLFSGAYKDSMNEYDINIYAGKTEKTNRTEEGPTFKVGASETEDYIAYVGTNPNIKGVTTQWCRYRRRNLVTKDHCTELIFQKHLPKLIVVDGKSLSTEDIPVLLEWCDKGIHMVFCGMPETRVAMRKEMETLLGIRSIREQDVELQGIVLHEGFLLGGGYSYIVRDKVTEKLQDLSLTTDWYEMGSGTKAYFTGLLDQSFYGETQNEYLPAIVWRNSIHDTKIFVVNGDYMEKATGIGFLSAMLNEIEEYSLYPVINAQSMVIVNYPSFTPENEETMEKLYSRNSYRVLREVVWPGLNAVLTNTDSKMTCMLTTKMDHNAVAEPSTEDLVFFMKLFREQKAEAGISCDQTSNVPVSMKLDTDELFLQKNLPNYQFQTAYVAKEYPVTMKKLLDIHGFSDVSTFLSDFEENKELVYLSGPDTVLTTINYGDTHYYSEDIRERAIETALGYSCVTEDLQHIIYPQGPEDEWQNVYSDFGRFTDTFYDPFDTFEELTLSESGERARQFLTTEYTEKRTGNRIDLHSEYDTGYFILRTHEETIDQITGADYEEIEDDAWLLSLNQKDVKITLKPEEIKPKKSFFGGGL